MAQKIYAQMEMLAPISDGKHLVNKQYVDDSLSKKFKDPVRVVTLENIEGVYDADAKTLKQNVGDVFIFDGVTVEEGDRVLVAHQTDAKQNGIYVVTTAGVKEVEAVSEVPESAPGAGDGTPAVEGVDAVQGVLTRAEDYDSSSKIAINALIPVSQGADHADSVWQLTNDAAVTLDADNMNFARIRGAEGARNFIGTITGDNLKKEWDVVHGLKNENVTVNITDADGAKCYFDVVVKDSNTITVKADTAPLTTESFTVLVLG